MQVRGRRVYPRHLFPEFVAPWIHYKRFRLRVVWFFTSPIDLKPLWMTSVVCGIFGVMLTILLFRHSPQAQAGTVTATPPRAGQPQRFAQSLLGAEFVNEWAARSRAHDDIELAPIEPDPLEEFNGVELTSHLVRTRVRPPFDVKAQVTHRSGDRFERKTPIAIHEQVDGWNAFNLFRERQSNPQSPYRLAAPQWDFASFASRIASADQPSLFGGADTRQPGFVVLREERASAAGEPAAYDIVIQNIGAESLFDLLVTENLSDVDAAIAAEPAARVSDYGLHWVIEELPSGTEQRFTVTLQASAGAEVGATTEVRSVVDVTSSTVVRPVPEPVSDEPLRRESDPAVLIETPQPSPFAVEPASSEYAPPERSIPGAPRIAVTGKLPEKASAGQEVSTVFEITNSGTADARDIVLTLFVPEQLEHSDGKKVEFRIRSLAAGATRRAMFRTLARKEGLATVDGTLASRDEPDYLWTGDVRIAAARPSSAKPLGKR